MKKTTRIMVGLMALSFAFASGVTDVSACQNAAPTAAQAMTKGEQVAKMGISLIGKVQFEHSYTPNIMKMDNPGFVYYVLQKSGIRLNVRDAHKMAKLGKAVPKSQLQKGDLVFFWNNMSMNKWDIQHVGIYIGDGKYVHMLNSKYDVTVNNLNSKYELEHYVTARRVF